MSFIYSQDPAEQARALDTAITHSTPNAPDPWFMAGSVEGPATGVFSGMIAKPALMLGDYATPSLTKAARSVGAESVATWLEGEQQKNVEMLKKLRERQASYGTVGRVLNGLGDVLPEAIAGGVAGSFASPGVGTVAGAATVPAAIQGYADYRMGVATEGLDESTAAKKGAITAAATALSAFIPMSAGARPLVSVGLGATSNVGLGMAQRGATSALLEANGYTEMAKQYQWLDKEAVLTDLVLGSAFGFFGAKMAGRRKPTVEEVDAAMLSAERQHVEFDSQPGVHRTPESREAGVQAYRNAEETMLVKNEMPDVTAYAQHMDTQPNPEVLKFHQDVAKEIEPFVPKELPPVEFVEKDVLYRGQPQDFRTLQTVAKADAIDNILIGRGIFTTTSKAVAETYGENIFRFEKPSGKSVFDLTNATDEQVATLAPELLKKVQTAPPIFLKGKTLPAEYKRPIDTYRQLLDFGKIKEAENFLFDAIAEKYMPTDVTWQQILNDPDSALSKGIKIDEVRAKISDDFQAAGFDFIKHQGGVRTGGAPHEVYIALNDAALREATQGKPHDGTLEGMAKTADVQPVENDLARQILDTYPDITIPTEAGERRLADVLAESDAEIVQAQKDGILHDVAVACFLRG